MDLLAHLPGWVKYDVLESGWNSLALRAIGTVQSAWRRARRPRGASPEPELNVRTYFGVSNVSSTLLEILAARYRAACQYVPSVYSGALTVYRAAGQPPLAPRDRMQGWGPLATGGVEVLDVSGHHNSCLSEPHVR